MWPFKRKPVVSSAVILLASNLNDKGKWFVIRHWADEVRIRYVPSSTVEISLYKLTEDKWTCCERWMTEDENKYFGNEFTKYRNNLDKDTLEEERTKIRNSITST